MTKLFIFALLAPQYMGGANAVKFNFSNIKIEFFQYFSCTKTSNYVDEPIDYYCEKTGEWFTIAMSGTCTITAETCQQAEKMARDCAVFTAHASAQAEINQLDQNCKSDTE